MGFGGFSHISFATWHILPTVAFLSRSPIIGALCFGSYGFARLSLSLVLFDRRDPFHEPSAGLALLQHDKGALHLLSATATVTVGLALAASAGVQ